MNSIGTFLKGIRRRSVRKRTVSVRFCLGLVQYYCFSKGEIDLTTELMCPILENIDHLQNMHLFEF